MKTSQPEALNLSSKYWLIFSILLMSLTQFVFELEIEPKKTTSNETAKFGAYKDEVYPTC